MSRFVTVTILPYQERAIVNIDAIAIVTSKPGPDGIRSAQLQMLDGSKIVITAAFADIEKVLICLGPDASPPGSPTT